MIIINKEYSLKLVTAPLVEPLELIEVKTYLRVDDTDSIEDAYISSLVTLAREYCESYQNRAYITQTWEMYLQEFPSVRTDTVNDCAESNIIEIPKGMLQKINSIAYKDLYGNTNIMVENTDYIVSNNGILGRVCPPYGTIFPCTPLFPLDPIVINFTCGYGDDSSKVPLKVKQAMLLLISHWYEYRAIINDLRGVTTNELPFAVTALLRSDRIINV